ncbi:outer membrane beta-barrel protein [Bacteroidota bacterium]
MEKIAQIIFLISALLLLKSESKAQFDYIGGGIVLATGGELKYDSYSYYNKSFGIDLRANYDYSKKLKIVPDFKFYLPNKEKFAAGGESKTTVYVFNLNIHYVLNSRSRNTYRLYLLGGAHVGAWQLTDSRVPSFGSPLDVSAFKFVPGANAGAGMQFQINDQTFFFAEIKYVISKANQMVFTPGLLFSI